LYGSGGVCLCVDEVLERNVTHAVCLSVEDEKVCAVVKIVLYCIVEFNAYYHHSNKTI
jgi:hypothetical protein